MHTSPQMLIPSAAYGLQQYEENTLLRYAEKMENTESQHSSCDG